MNLAKHIISVLLGYWLYHCHIEFHAEIGMALIFKVGEHSDFPPIPKNFPTCGDFIPTDTDQSTGSLDKMNHQPVISITHWWPLDYFNAASSSKRQLSGKLLTIGAMILVMVFGRVFAL